MNNFKLTDQDKVDHYLNALKHHIINKSWWFRKLNRMVQKVKDTQEFKDFCIAKHDIWELQVWVLYLFFKK